MSSMPLEPTAPTALSRRSAGTVSSGALGSVPGKPGAVPESGRRLDKELAVPAIPLATVIPFPERKPGAVQREEREAGMATAEYAIATLAAVAFAALLVAVLSSGDVRELLMSLIRAALSFG